MRPTISRFARYLGFFLGMRKIRARFILLGAVMLSSGLIAIALINRWEGGGDGCGIDYYVPLRPMTPAEAAYLLQRDEFTTVTALTSASATIASSHYVRTYTDSAGRQTSELATASDSYYYGEYSIPRSELEAALRRTLTPADVAPYTALSNKTPERTFSPSDVWKYAAIEILALSTLLSGVVLAFQRIRSPWHLIHPFTVAQIALLVFVPFYAPALLDYDYFFQRVALEFIWFNVADYTLLPSLFLSLFCLACVGWQQLRRRIMRRLVHSVT